MSSIRGCLLALLVLSVSLLHSQTASSDSSSSSETTTFRSNVRRVLVDVVVTDSKDEPVTGCQKKISRFSKMATLKL